MGTGGTGKVAELRRAVHREERTVVVLCFVLFMLVLTAAVLWHHVFRIIQADRIALPAEVEAPSTKEPILPETETETLVSLPEASEDAAAAMASHSRWTMAQLPTVIKRLPEEEPFVYLTFDDGPTKYLPAVVDILLEKQAPATFFWIGQYASPTPEVLEKMREAGFAFGTHTVNHRRLAGLSYEKQRKEIERGIAELAQWTGVKTAYVRPPYGAWDAVTEQAANDLGLKLVLWSVDPRDWEKKATPEAIVQKVLSQLHPGAVILLHETDATVQALPTLIDRIRQQGYEVAGLPCE